MADFTLDHKAFDLALDKWLVETVLATAVGAKEASKVVIESAKAGINSKSGRLAASIGSEVTGGIVGYEARIGPQGVEYARKVELGKHNPHGAMGHPYLKPGLTRAMGLLTEPFAAAWRGALPKG